MKLGSSEGIKKEHFSDCLNILNLDMDELSEFVSAGRSFGSALELVENMLDNSDINPAQVLEVFNKLLEERVELEKSTGEIASKYENYIAAMKQEVAS